VQSTALSSANDEYDEDERVAFENLDRWTTGADLMNDRVGDALAGFIEGLSVNDVQFQGDAAEQPAGSAPPERPTLEGEGVKKNSFWDMFSGSSAPQQAAPAVAEMATRGTNEGIGNGGDDDASAGSGSGSTGSGSEDSGSSSSSARKRSLWKDLSGEDAGKYQRGSGLANLWEGNDFAHDEHSTERKEQRRMACAIVLWVIVISCLISSFSKRVGRSYEGTLPASSHQPGVDITLSRGETFDLLASISPDLAQQRRNSPQYKAFEWVSSQKLKVSNYRIIQRFVLATFYYSTYGESWDIDYKGDDDMWLSHWNECRWRGVRCLDYRTHKIVEAVTLINMSGYGVSGKIPSEIGELPFLEILHLNDNALTGFIPQSLVTLTNLRELSLQHNQLSGRIPSYFGNMRRLENVNLSFNEFIGEIPSGLSRWESVIKIDMSHNKLAGPFPKELKGLKNLEILALSDNHLTGELPDWFGDFNSLKVLSLENNKFHGTISEAIGELMQLTRLFLGGNYITGRIPHRIGFLTFLTHVDLSQNQLESPIPHSFVNLEKLQSLFLHENKLFGSIPKYFGATSPLNRLTLHKNNLKGVMPPRLCQAKLKVMTSDCGGIDPYVECSCCTECWMH